MKEGLRRTMTTDTSSSYNEFLKRFELLISLHPNLITTTLSNIFTMRLIGNKAHGDLGEIAISEFINQFMYDYESKHVGKDLFRAKSSEEDILIVSLVDKRETPISLKAYGDGPLQLSTDKSSLMFPLLESFGVAEIPPPLIKTVYAHQAFTQFTSVNVLPLIYRETDKQCNIMVFDMENAKAATKRIVKVSDTGGRGRKHPVWKFEDSEGNYICEVRYGDARANALQRGFWTNTKNALPFFHSVTKGWIDYSHNLVLVDLFAKALNANIEGHKAALKEIEKNLKEIKEIEKLP